MNKDAGRGQLIFVTVQLEDGEQLPFLLDNGTQMTCLDKSLEPKLGKPHWRKVLVLRGQYSSVARLYDAPELFLGKAQLMKTGSDVVTLDLRSLSLEVGHPVLGILGMDVLRHYCMQFDFTDNKIRFFDGKNLDQTTLGKPFHLYNMGNHRMAVDPDLTGHINGSFIDLGCNFDGLLWSPEYFEWTNQLTLPRRGLARYPDAIFDGVTYTNMCVGEGGKFNYEFFNLEIACDTIGLHFLSRNLVTLDFPGSTLYLKQTSIGPLDNNNMRPISEMDRISTEVCLKNLAEMGELPGWSIRDKGKMAMSSFVHDNQITVYCQNDRNRSINNYVIGFSTNGTSWGLKKAWQTDAHGNFIQEYPIK